VLNMWPSLGTSTMQSWINNIRAQNPGVKIAQYVVLNEAPASVATTHDDYAMVTQINNMNWWVRDAAGSLVQWTGAFGNYEINLTGWTQADATGKRWPQWKATNDTRTMFANLSGIDYVFNDNTMWQPRYDADHMRVGTNQLRSDPTIQSAFRKGYVDYWSTLRSLNPTLKIMGNVDQDLSQAEYKGQLEGAFSECLQGKSWSVETWAGWEGMMKRYRATITNTRAPNVAIFQTCAINGAVPAQARYGFASALLESGYFMYTVTGATTPFRIDEFDAPLGTPAEAAPIAATSSGIWMRRYSNGLVLVNPSSSTLTINVGAGYKRLSGTQEPSVNNGAVESSVTLPPKSGLLMLKA
jgi:hypothetical protein